MAKKARCDRTGVSPCVITGIGSGEIVAACVNDKLTLVQGAKAIKQLADDLEHQDQHNQYNGYTQLKQTLNQFAADGEILITIGEFPRIIRTPTAKSV